jgi:hypothetical protein
MRHAARLPAWLAVVAISVAPVLGGCTVLSGFAPAPACGGFHLLVINRGPSPVAVRLNGTPSETVDAGTDGTIYQYGPGGVSDMPWTVTVVEPSTGTVLATRDVTESSGDGGATIEVDGGPSGAPVVGEVQRGRGC